MTKDPEINLVQLDADYLSPDQKKIFEQFGKPIKIMKEQAIEYNTYIWVYKENIVKFKEDGTLIKVI